MRIARNHCGFWIAFEWISLEARIKCKCVIATSVVDINFMSEFLTLYSIHADHFTIYYLVDCRWSGRRITFCCSQQCIQITGWCIHLIGVWINLWLSIILWSALANCRRFGWATCWCKSTIWEGGMCNAIDNG